MSEIPAEARPHRTRRQPDWDPFGIDEGAAPAREDAGIELSELELAYSACFSTPAGQAVLADLERWCSPLNVTGYQPGVPFNDAAAHLLYREGQLSMVAYVVKKMRMIREKANG